MPKAIRVYQPGDADVMRWEEVVTPAPAPDEILIRHTAIGLNFIDVYHRSGLYPVADMPFTPGIEGVGVVEGVGRNVDEAFKIGDRVGYGKGPMGAYAHYRTIHQEQVLKIPDIISDEHAVGAMVQGMTAHFLLRQTFNLQKDMTILIHAAAGSVGSLMCQWANHLGATVIGTVGSEEKAQWAKQHGCHHTILYREEDFVQKVQEITEGKGCNVVYDSVGKDTFLGSLDCLMNFGMMVSFGQSSGPAPAIAPSLLMEKGSLFLTRPSLMDYRSYYMEYASSALEVFSMIAQGQLQIHVGQSYYLSDVQTAHRDLEGRRTKGSTILIPDPM